MGEGVSGEASEVEGVEGVARAGDEVTLYAGLGSHELDHGSPLSQAIRHAQRGDSVTARHAPGDEYPRPLRVLTLLGQRASIRGV